ncbi:MAG TPA: response regulator [Anaerolineae bacterium]|nr:response regulator [Anaerolineae bacterium]
MSNQAKAQRAPISASAGVTPPRARILVADDDPEMQALLQLMLKWDGFEVLEAPNSEEMLERTLDSDPALILLDVMLPGVDGFEVLRRLKSDPRTCAVPVIFVSARSDQQARRQGLALGAADYLEKPISLRSLISSVRAAIQRRAVTELFNSALSRA